MIQIFQPNKLQIFDCQKYIIFLRLVPVILNLEHSFCQNCCFDCSQYLFMKHLIAENGRFCKVWINVYKRKKCLLITFISKKYIIYIT